MESNNKLIGVYKNEHIQKLKDKIEKLESNKTNYIYIEHHQISNNEGYLEECEYENENFLVNQPHTNSNGVWGFTTCTARDTKLKQNLWIHQYWFDLSKYTIGTDIKTDNILTIALRNLKK